MNKMKHISSKDTDIVAQNNTLIDAPKDLSLLEYKLFLIVVSKIDPMCDEIPVFSISAEEFCKATGIKDNGSVYRDLQKAADRLMKRVARTYDPELNITINVNLTRKALYWHDQGRIEIHLSNDIKPFLVNLQKEFTQYKLSNVSHMASLYAIRLYELLKKQENFGKRIFELDDLRIKLGISKGQYSRFSDFKRSVLKIAIKEINNKTDIAIKFELKKTRQKFTHIKFDIKTKPNSTKDTPKPETLKKIKNLGYNTPQALDIAFQADKKTIDNAVSAVTEQVENGNAKDPKAMLQIAIEEEWKPTSKAKKGTTSTSKTKNSNKRVSLSKIFNWLHSKI